uniref:EGF-like domain-containing protein n=1 Tax=Timema bartmani TaxID=61472 RepID=A0A7R9EVP2_9NEOP|nr:unnamed protein product [Timema bartmani]
MDVDECSSVPCQNGGTCVDLVDGFRCKCTPEWEGSACQFDADECQDSPCINAYSCQNLVGDYKCKCQKGWAGKNCDHNINDCVGQCLHGGTCIDLVNNYHCACQAGYTGRHCDTDINECANNPCMNQGECSDRVNGYRCICAVGYIGEQCEVKNDHCINNPCKNEAHCFNTQGDYYCLCSEEWQGKNCSTKRQQCLHPPCEVIDSCTVSAPSGSAIMVPSGICGDHGMCVGLPGGGFRCSCEAGYTGQYCHENINDCKVNPCQNGGTCVDKVSSFQCICKEGWEGEICATNLKKDLFRGSGGRLENHFVKTTLSTPNRDSNLDLPIIVSLDYCESSTLGHVRRDLLWRREVPVKCKEVLYKAYIVPSVTYAAKTWKGNIRKTKKMEAMGMKFVRSMLAVTRRNKIEFIRERMRVQRVHEIVEEAKQNKDECIPNPCRNNGSCLDGIADFVCSCRDGWKGKTCNLKDSHCDRSTCRNGGTCQDLGDTYVCLCLPDWEGTTCHIAKSYACKSNPCQNGATCVNTGDFYSCICKEGFEGQHCQHDINDCNPLPCFNGGKCIDGVNWFLCECAPGFTGPDCRININECASNPCGYGSTCVDDIGQFQCLCPKGRIGVRCEGVEVMAYSPGTCFWNTQYYSNNASWQYECNMCSCEDSVVKCTKVWCGLGNCLGQDSIICQPNQVCVPSPREACLAPPCVPWGECRDLQSGKRVGPPQLPSLPSCWPNQASLSLSCVRLSLYVDRNKLPPGVSIEGLCDQLRILLALHQASLESDHQLVLLCDLKQGYNDTIEATLVSNWQSSLSQSTGLQENTAVTDGIKVLGEAISRKQTNFPVFTSSVVEVKVETAIATSREEKKKEDNGYFIALICIILVLVLGAVVGSLYYWHNVWRRRIMLGSGAHLGGSRATNCDDEKSNNLQNEENLRRYVANPLKEESVPSLVSAKSSTSVESISDCQPHRVSVVRPLSTDASSSTSTAEMLEVIPDPDVVPVKPLATDLSRQSSPRRNSQILLFKAQSPDVRKNTAAFDDIGPHKDFAKRVINLKVLPSVQRTFQPPCEVDRGGGDMLTVIV